MYNVTDTDHDFNPLFIAKKPCPLLVFFSFLFIFDTAKLQVIKLLLSLTAVQPPHSNYLYSLAFIISCQQGVMTINIETKHIESNREISELNETRKIPVV